MKRLRDILRLNEMAVVNFRLEDTLRKMNDDEATIPGFLLKNLGQHHYDHIGNLTTGEKTYQVIRSKDGHTVHALYSDREGVGGRGARLSAMTINTDPHRLPSGEHAHSIFLAKKHIDAPFPAAHLYRWLAHNVSPLVSDTTMSPRTQANYYSMFMNQDEHGITMSGLDPTGKEFPLKNREDFENLFIYRSKDRNVPVGGNLPAHKVVHMGGKRILIRSALTKGETS